MSKSNKWIDIGKNIIKSYSNIHIRGKKCDAMIFSTPRSGSTWLMELIWTQRGFKCINEPLNLRVSIIRENLGLNSWDELYNEESKQKVIDYFKAFSLGRSHFYDPHPFQKNYRPITNRIVFKILHGGELWINQIANSCNAKVIYLIRHPIAVSLSRQKLPRIDVLLSDSVLNHFPETMGHKAREVYNNGSFLEKAVLSWCLQNKLALSQRNDDWIFITYEQLTSDPFPVIKKLIDELGLEQEERLLNRLSVPSAVKSQSDGYTQELLNKKKHKSRELVEKWTKKVTKESERKLYDIIDVFDIGVYGYGSCYPNKEYNIF